MLKGRGALAGLTNALPAFGKEVRKIKKENREADRLLRASEIQLATADQARADGMVGKATELEKDAQTKAQKAAEMKTNVAEKELTIAATIRGQDVQAASARATANKRTYEQESVDAKLASALAADPSIAQDPAKLAAAKSKAYSDTAKETRTAASIPEKLESAAGIAGGKLSAAQEEALNKELSGNGPYLKAMNKGNYEEATRIREQVRAVITKQEGQTVAPTANSNIRAQVERSGQAYDPAKYDYRIAPDGSIQRKAK